LRAFLAIAALAAAAPLAAHELVTVASRPGVTQSFLVIDTGSVKPQAIALLYTGGGGRIDLRREDGELKYRPHNFLVRAAADFARNGVLPVVMDAPSDQNELTDDYRRGSAQSADARAVVRELKQRFAGLPVYLVGTSRGTVSAAVLGRELGDEVAGVVLTSSMFGSSNVRRQAPNLRGFDYGAIRARLLLVHHREDGCEHTPYASAERLAARYPLVSVSGGKPPQSGPCEPYAAHGYFGREAETAAAIAAWMLGRPFPKDIE
jgi:pimeloyl-ACP methyl ester carboxylesterase